MAYRVSWLLLAGVVLVIGVGLAILALPPVELAVVAALGAGAGAALQRRLSRWPVLHRHSVMAGCLGTLVLTGLVATLGLSGAGIVGLLLVGALPLLLPHERSDEPAGLACRPSTAAAPASPELPELVDVGEEPLESVVAGWTDEELCWAWRCSFSRLQRASNADGLARVGEERRVYLDEIERRDPRGFAAWMRNGARAASDPGRYLGLDR